MKAIILAAGIGKRLGEISGGKPKCLLEFDGISLLHRHIAVLRQLEIDNILIVTGYRQDDILIELDKLKHDAVIKTQFNPDFESGSVISLYTALTFLESGDDIVVMDADVLCHPDIMQRLIESRHKNCFLLDRDFEPGEEPVKICVRGNTMVDFRKQIDKQLQFDYQGESVGFFKFSSDIGNKLAERCLHYINHDQGNVPYEEVIRDLLLETPNNFSYEDISGLPWIEIDFPEDVERAEQEILKLIA